MSGAYDWGMDVAAKHFGAPVGPAVPDTSGEAGPTTERQAGAAVLQPRARLGEEGTAPGINIEPGSNDDGWEIPPPVMVEDGTRVQGEEDGEVQHAGFEEIKAARRSICLEV